MMRAFTTPKKMKNPVTTPGLPSNTAALFPIDSWMVREEAFNLEHATLAESVFAQANGFLGTRGTFEEGMTGNPTSTEGTYLNGVYFREKYSYPEIAYAFATHNNKMIQAPNGKSIALFLDGERFLPGQSRITSYRRQMDFRTGVLERVVCWETQTGKQLEIQSKRLVSLADKHIITLRYTIKALNFDGDIALESVLDATYGGAVTDPNDPRIGQLSIKGSLDEKDRASSNLGGSLLHHVKGGDFVLHTSYRQSFSGGEPKNVTAINEPGRVGQRFELRLTKNKAITLTKFIAYHHGGKTNESELIKAAEQSLAKATEQGFEKFEESQKSNLKEFWNNAEVSIDGDAALQQGMHFNLFHIYQSVGKDGKSNIAAKGLTGPGYDGHYFWDTEIYVIPFLVFSYPEIARKLLEFRHSILDKARERARQMSHTKGALFAWRTIGGEECSAYFPAGTAQYHINAAVAYAIGQYLEATEDWEFIKKFGAEILWETARIWLGIGHFNDRKNGQFCIHGVTGPDEYSAMVDNNFYTNAMARHHLRLACKVAAYLEKHDPACYNSLVKKVGLEPAELTEWRNAADKMFLPYDEALGINPQDATFLDKPKWDIASTPDDKRPLLIHYHPLVIYRHQVLKQPDVVLAMVLLGDQFDLELKRRNFEYYDPLTTHDSTLSTCMNSVACSELGLYAKAYEYFIETARMDLDNRHNNTDYGLHAACMAGSWMTVVMGFGGMRIREGRPSFDPYLPQAWKGYGFSVCYRGQRLRIEVKDGEAHYQLVQGNDMRISHHGKDLHVRANEPIVVPLRGGAKATA